jgi:diguanylate cyclase (GGDEF)-like protein
MPSHDVTAHRLRRRQLSGVTTALAIGLAFFGIAGYLTDSRLLGQLGSQKPAVVESLFCSLAIALSFWLRRRSSHRRFVVSLLLALPLLAVSLGVAETLLHLGPLVALAGRHIANASLGATPTRMALSTCLGVSALSLGALIEMWTPSRRSAKLALAAAIFAASLGLLGVLSDALSLDFLYQPLGLTRAAPIAAWLLLLLGFSLWSDSPRGTIRSPADDFRLNSVIRLVVVLVASCTGLACFSVMQQRLEVVLGEELNQHVLERANFTASTIAVFEDRAAVVAAAPGLAQLISQASADNHGPDAALTQMALDFLPHGYSAIAFASPTGHVLASAGRFSPLDSAGANVSVPLKMRDTTERMGFDDEYFLLAKEPVMGDRGIAGYAISQQSIQSLTRLTATSGTMGASTVVSLCAARNDNIVCFPSSQHARPFQLDTQEDAALIDLVARALSGRTGSRRTSGRAGEPLLAAYRPVGDTGLALIMTSDLSDVYAPIRAALESILPLVVALAIGAILIVQWFVRPLLRQLLAARRVAENSEARFRAAAEGSLDALYIFEAVRGPDHQVTDFKFTYVNSHGERLLGVPRNALLGALLCERLRDTRKSGWFDRYVRVLETATPTSGEVAVWWPGMRSNWIHQHVAPLGDGVAVTMRDISAQKAAQELLRHAAHTDSLTGLPNRALLVDRIERAILRSRRHGGAIAVFYMDIDHFKRVNDRHGHAAGDAVLREFGARLSRCVRAEDTVARLGGDEFCVLLESFGHRGETFRIAESILAATRIPMSIEGVMVHVTTSIGIAFFRAADHSAAHLLMRADEALYEVKRRGRDGYYAADSESLLSEAHELGNPLYDE